MLNELLKRYPSLALCDEEITHAINLLCDSYQSGGKLLLCGNGGSCADCEHITGELMKGFLSKRSLCEEHQNKFDILYGADGKKMAEKLQYGFPTIPLPALSGLVSAFSNDVDAELVYAQMVWGFGKPQDVLLGISTSGNAENVCNACMTAKAKGMSCIGLSGSARGKMDDICDFVIHAPASETYKIQELHLPIYHAICAEVEERLFH